MDERADILISRVVDGVASGVDLAELETLGTARPGVWRELALAQRDQALLVQEVSRRVAVADVVELPTGVETRRESSSFSSRWKRAGVWGGWAAAAVLALVAIDVGPKGGVEQAGLIPSMKVLEDGLTADQAWQLYEATGNREQRLIGVMPERVLIEATPSADGKSVRMVFLRQLIETKTVDAVYKRSMDEAGQGRMVPAELPPATPVAPAAAFDGVSQPAKRRVLPPV